MILSAGHRSQEGANVLSEKPPGKEKITTAIICVAKPIKIPIGTEASVLVTTAGSGLMTIKGPKNQKKMNQMLPARGKEDVWPHSAFQLLVTSFSWKPVLLHKHAIFSVGIEPPRAVVTPKIDEEKEPPKMHEIEETVQQEGEVNKIKDQNGNR